MKRMALFALPLFCIAPIANAQITKGTTLLGGGVGFNAYKAEAGSNSPGRYTYLRIQPSVGIAVKENLATGISLLPTNYTCTVNLS